MSLWERYLSKEIGIEFKACLYFYCILLFYCCVQLLEGKNSASILIMAEMILTAYVMGYIQVYLLHNFDEAESFGRWQLLGSILCTMLYTGLSYLFGWFSRELVATAVYAVFMLLCYVCVYWVYRIKRTIDTKQLNRDLETFKQRGVQEGGQYGRK